MIWLLIFLAAVEVVFYVGVLWWCFRRWLDFLAAVVPAEHAHYGRLNEPLPVYRFPKDSIERMQKYAREEGE